MATIDTLKRDIRQKATGLTKPLSDSLYAAAFHVLAAAERTSYQDFILPQLSRLIDDLLKSRTSISVLEIGPGPESILEHLSLHLRQKIAKYVAFEPNNLFATSVEDWLSCPASPLPGLSSASVHRCHFTHSTSNGTDGKFDIVIFCHSLYGMKQKTQVVERSLEFLEQGGTVTVFHRQEALDLSHLVCCRTASHPGVSRVPNDDKTLDCLTPLIAGYTMQDVAVDDAVRIEWRETCRALAKHEPGHLVFSCPVVMVAFNHQAKVLPRLLAQVPPNARTVKNREARHRRPATVVRPTDISQVQQCVAWALRWNLPLTVIGGGHSGHCLAPNVVSVDMSMFNEVHVVSAVDGNHADVVVAGAGCTTADIICKTSDARLVVPLGSRPSVGAGLWLQGGIGHLARLHGLSCDSIIGAVLVGLVSGQILCVGHVPSQQCPPGAVRPENEEELLWALRGAGTNFGIVCSVTFKAFPAPTYRLRSRVLRFDDGSEGAASLTKYIEGSQRLGRQFATDFYLYHERGCVNIGITEHLIVNDSLEPMYAVSQNSEPGDLVSVADSIGMFETEMYMSTMHGGHAGGKTSSFKRCVFFESLTKQAIHLIMTAIDSRPSPLCYFHLLQGGEAVQDLGPHDSAFGCRSWSFACVITGVWPREEDGYAIAQASVQWVYDVADSLLPLSEGVYGADLGPDPRDAALATKAFGSNRRRLALLKKRLDPQNVLAYACPLQMARQRVIILVTGSSGAGKDYCAKVWVSYLQEHHLAAKALSISEVTKRKYANASGADLDRLLTDRAYKEQHRSALTEYFQDRVKERPQMPEEHFLDTVQRAGEVDVLFITGIRDEAPVAAFAHLVPESKLLEVRVDASSDIRQSRRRCQANQVYEHEHADSAASSSCLTFHNDAPGHSAAEEFAKRRFLPLEHDDQQRLAEMVRSVPGFPQSGVEFRHVLGVAPHPRGLSLCASLLHLHFAGDWEKVGMIAACEAGGFVFASALATHTGIPMVPLRKAGKLPPPVISSSKFPSHIASMATSSSSSETIEVSEGTVPAGTSVVVVDDVMATGRTLLAVLELLKKVGVTAENISIMVIAEFPTHRGRQLLRDHGFGAVRIQSLLVFGGA